MSGRKTAIVTITADGRDRGKVFVLTEMSATQAEEWGARAFLALGRNRVDIPPELAGAGLAGWAVLGLQALGGVPWQDAKPLMDEMMACVTIQPDPDNPAVVRRLMEEDIQEVLTRLHLRSEVFMLHTGFSIGGALLKSRSTPRP